MLYVLLLAITLLTPNLSLDIYPSTIAPITSYQFAEVNGYGMQLRRERLSLSYYKVTYRSRKSDGLLNLGSGWVYQREADFWTADWLIYRKNSFGIGVGLNRIDDYELGWQLYAEKSFSDIVFARLGFWQIQAEEPVKSIMIGFGVNLSKIVKERIFKE